MTDQSAISRLLAIMAALRTPGTGCPWDLEQSFATIAPYTIEEAYEVADAIARGDRVGLKEELGDLMFQVVFHARMAEEEGIFDFEDVVTALCDKMEARHPHVFSSRIIETADQQTANWEAIKAAERAAKRQDDPSLLADIPLALPALMRAEKLTKRAARVGFDWPTLDEVFAKLAEEIGETREAISEADQAHIEEEIGDVLFVLANLARKAKVDPEVALRSANAKFERRFRWIEQALNQSGTSPEHSSLEEMDRLWNDAKRAERNL
ncbi:nucleoside triphosphate pyrophosphohydrolase [Candidatus Phycosocius bacilliformis]|uniref:Nucleoside triphosphate pyrophosphohydrolase n=1 Tax=Candidatus Phycosocius bacilliformis TaxID=1445552 RepID=A0A2P2E7X7_9PROT|nr:nucleoside triphosphate pyrophosphohydrolase [Candidatus Phycosocius bacilliformis]GBF57168.1 nucleoside triphosphate pyrophosphohydrolase [Candidatus Phycosocius bacilliformis]